MKELPKTPELNQEKLISIIKENFLQFDHYSYNRVLQEFFSPEGKFIGDNVFETTFALRENQAPLVFEVSGPYDAFSNQYPTLARVFLCGDLIYQCDIKPGIMQRTAAMAWLYLDVLGHKPHKVLLFGAGKLGVHIGIYLKHFIAGLDRLDYNDSKGPQSVFEEQIREKGLEANFVSNPNLTLYDTIFMATNTNKHILDTNNIQQLQLGSYVISLCTTSQTGEISEEVYSRDNVNIFLDYEDSKRFTIDMKRADEKGLLSTAILFPDAVKQQTGYDLDARINLIRLTGTPMQNIAVIQMMMEQDGVIYESRNGK